MVFFLPCYPKSLCDGQMWGLVYDVGIIQLCDVIRDPQTSGSDRYIFVSQITCYFFWMVVCEIVLLN
jgi:hypothetical protein